jgi:hypothetical protein
LNNIYNNNGNNNNNNNGTNNYNNNGNNNGLMSQIVLISGDRGEIVSSLNNPSPGTDGNNPQ